MPARRQATQHRGIVARLDTKSKPNAGDVIFAPDYTVTSTEDDGGRVLGNVEVILCFWGSFWSSNPPPSPSSDDYKTAIEAILAGPFMGGLRQYRGVGQGTLIYSEINDSSDPNDVYTDADVVNMLKSRFQNTSMPQPAAGHDRFYAVILPVNKANSLSNLAGQHQSFQYNGQTAYYAWVDNSGSLTGHNCVTKVFSHELVEACTNPDVATLNNSILVNGTKADGSTVTKDEIGDTCNNQFATADMNGVECSVQSYWSKADGACILPLGTATFWVDKSTFGRDEVQDVINTNGGRFRNAFWVVVEGFSRNTFSSLQVTVPTPTGPFANLTGLTIAPNGNVDFENAADPAAPQRIRVAFDIVFTTATLAQFPGSASQAFGLNAFIETHGNRVPGSDASTLFELVAGADPYFTNVDPAQGNVFYLSQDLRVFTATPGQSPTPIPGGPTFGVNGPAGAFAYIQQLLGWLNSNFSDPAGTDPFSSLLPGQGAALQADSSVTPVTIDFSNIFNIHVYNNYAFAVARVRLRGSAGTAGEARNVRVFFRLFATESPDTDFQPASTYPSNTDAAGNPVSPQVGASHVTLPFFATGDLASNTDYSVGGVNDLDIEIASGKDSVRAYFGCFLNLYDPGNVIDSKQIQAWLAGTHHCLVAQIAFDDAPVTVGASPGSSDKLAQRNLQVTHSDNPGPPGAHRIPQTFDIRPSPATAGDAVDELMFDWGAVPSGSVAAVYWPQVPSTAVLSLASALYASHGLVALDDHTIQCMVSGGITYLPIPPGADENLAGLLTIDLPNTIVTGQEFDIRVRRVGRRGVERPELSRQAAVSSPEGGEAVTRAASSHRLAAWRYVIGTFQVKIPVSTAAVMLRPEEDALAIMKWRLGQLAPSSRWYPVLHRYVSYLSDRVASLGGDPDAIPGSLSGAPVRFPGRHDDLLEYCGKVSELLFDCFGDFEGFVLADCGSVRRFASRERQICEIAWRACRDRVTLVVYVSRREPERIRGLAIRS